MKALLLSGGLDSVSLAYWLKPSIAITVNYGQNCADAEIRASKTICKKLCIDHHVINVNLNEIGSGDLSKKVVSKSGPKSDWWPYRNQLLITIVSTYILSNNLSVNEIIFGTLKSDGYHADGKESFFKSMNELLKIQEGDIQVSTPAIHLTCIELIKTSMIQSSLLGWSHSCHKSNYACGNCRGCFKQQNVFNELGWIL